MSNEKDALKQLEEILKGFWRKHGSSSIIAAKHTEFIVEPKIFLGNRLNPEVLKMLVISYLENTSTQDSGAGNIDATPEKLVIKSPSGKPLVIVRDQKIIQQYYSRNN